MPKGDPSYKNYRHKSGDAPSATPTGKKNDPHAGAAGKMSVGMPDGRVSDLGRMSSNGPDGPSMSLRVKNLVKGRYHKSGGPRNPS